MDVLLRLVGDSSVVCADDYLYIASQDSMLYISAIQTKPTKRIVCAQSSAQADAAGIAAMQNRSVSSALGGRALTSAATSATEHGAPRRWPLSEAAAAVRARTADLLRQVRGYLLRQPRACKRALLLAADTSVCFAALTSAAWLHGVPLTALLRPWWQVPVTILIVIACCASRKLYKCVTRFIMLGDAFHVMQAVLIATLAALSLRLVVTMPALPPVVLLNFAVIAVCGLEAWRFLARYFLTQISDPDAERILVYGAGEVGVQAVRALASDHRRRVIGFLEDREPGLIGARVADLPVYGLADIENLIERDKINAVLLAVPSTSRRLKQRIVDRLGPYRLTVKTVPDLQDILSGRARVSEIRDVEIEDLLGRDPVPPDMRLLTKSIVGRNVMVTGAGGSIGSELCRQIARLGPRRLVLFEANEYSLFQVERELRAVPGAGDVEIRAILGNVLNGAFVEGCIERFRIQTIYHAAAYKHVPLVERNVRAAVHNNIRGTHNVADAALRRNVEQCILVSTDKAVRPTSVMGATKRVAELIAQAYARRAKDRDPEAGCVFSIVRFGNVLGSSGSVVPCFREQIMAGGPVTVTHPEITRFFMTAREAAQLVIQAGAMARGGEVYVLDMGSPVRIVDLARTMIRLSGYTVRDSNNPDGDIEIMFTGLRPGEKLYEELLIGRNTATTTHPKIGCAIESALSWEALEPMLEAMYRLGQESDHREIRRLLKDAVPEYSCSNG